MKKGKYTDKEYDIMDKIKRENKKLKKELKAARKMLDRYLVIEDKGLIKDNEILPSKKRNREKELKEHWACRGDGCDGVLKLHIIANKYWRTCTVCNRRTKGQIVSESIEELRKRSIT